MSRQARWYDSPVPNRRLSPCLLALFLFGCEAAPPDPGAVVLPGDDDDSAGDDDDATGDDDDATSPSGLTAWAVLLEVETLGAGNTSLGYASSAVASFGSGDPLPFGDPGVNGHLLPGAGLHPEQFDGEESCDTITASDALDPLPASDPVGGVVHYEPATAAPTLELEDTGGVYTWSEAEALPAISYSIGVKGGAVWPPASLDGALELPAPVSGFIQGPGGTISNLSVIEFRWTADSDPGGVEVIFFRWTTANQTDWAAVRCRSADDGSVFMDASALAAGSGDITVTVSRAAWVTSGLQAGEQVVAAHAGAVRSVSWDLTPVGR